MPNRTRIATALLKAGRFLPLVVAAVLLIGGFIYRDRLTVDVLLADTPRSFPLAALALLAFFALKSLSVVIPIALLYMGAGLLFSPVWALLVNLAGTAVCLTLPFLLGKLYGRGLMDKLTLKYPAVRRLDEIRSDNEYFLSYIVKVSGVIPGDISSMLFGAMGMRYRRYLIGATLGMLPFMIATTFFGSNVTDPHSPGFWISLLSIPVIVGLSFLVYRLYLRKKRRQRAAKNGEEP